MNTVAFPSPSADLSVVIRALRGELGGWGVLGWLPDALVRLLFGRLGVILARMEGLVSRFRDGRVVRRAPVVAVVASGSEREARPARETAGIGRPTGFAWLVRRVGYRAVGYGSQLRHVLEQPEMVALLKACPQAARVLQPLCRMLAVETSLLHPGVPVVVVAPKVARGRVRKPRVPIDWGRIPLPRGVLSAARRAGFKSVR